MNCDHFQNLIGRELDGVIQPDEQAALEAHLRACPACTRESAEQHAIRGAFASLRDRSVPAGMAERIAARALAAPAPVFQFPRSRLVPIAAAALLVCVGSAWFGSRLAHRPTSVIAGPTAREARESEFRQLMHERVLVPLPKVEKMLADQARFESALDDARRQYEEKVRSINQDALAATWKDLTPEEQQRYRKIDPTFEPPPASGR